MFLAILAAILAAISSTSLLTFFMSVFTARMPVFVAVISVFTGVNIRLLPENICLHYNNIRFQAGDIDLNIGQAPKLSRRDANSTGGKSSKVGKVSF